MVTKTFGDTLFPGTEFLEFPSPESLKGKILISTKPPKESDDTLEKSEEFTDMSLPSESGSKKGNEFDMQIKVSRKSPHV